MLGLAHRGYRLADYDHHLVHTLRAAGYTSTLIGEQHVSADPRGHRLRRDRRARLQPRGEVAPAAARLPAQRPSEPFFLSVGFFETHRDFFEPTSVRDALYSLPPANLPDTPETRRDMAAYKASARSLDQGVGTVLDAIERREHARDLHHRPRARVPGRQGDADRPRHRRAADHARPGRLHAAARSPTRSSPRSTSSRRSASCSGSSAPPGCAGSRCSQREQRRGVCGDHLPRRLRAAARGAHEALQVHPALRSHEDPCSRTSTTAPARTTCWPTGWPSATPPPEELYDLVFDPNEANNIVGDPSRDDRRRAARAAGRAGWRRPATRCWTARSRPPPGTEYQHARPALPVRPDDGGR